MIEEPLARDMAEDSVGFLQALRRPDAPSERSAALVVQSGNGSFAVREGRWKLCLAPGSGGLSSPRPGSPEERGLPAVQLCNLEADPAEAQNLYAQHPEVVKRLTGQLSISRSGQEPNGAVAG